MQEQSETSEARYARLRESLREWLIEQQQRKERKESYDPHAEEVNPDLLTENDLAMWEVISTPERLAEITRDRWNEYDSYSKRDRAAEENEETKKSQEAFRALAANKATKPLVEKARKDKPQ